MSEFKKNSFSISRFRTEDLKIGIMHLARVSWKKSMVV